MGRVSAEKAHAKRNPVSRDAVWKAIRNLNGSVEDFTIGDLAHLTRQSSETIRTYLRGLVAAKVLEEVAPPKPFSSARYRLVRDLGIEAPRVRRDGAPVTQGASREQMWRTMKIVGTFSAVDLAAQASLPDSPVSEVDAKDYCKRLAWAGYLAVVERGKAGKGGKPSVYRFVKSRNTGPRPPMIQKLDSVFDPNTRMVVWQAEPRA